ncbi:hypothetical protein BJV82DRAFT_661333 [Fennellomyces sp. T-0311]|nr:hypothetical protein BJV82DRAFT_661333 [Fennellomyces sp. T-0311]
MAGEDEVGSCISSKVVKSTKWCVEPVSSWRVRQIKNKSTRNSQREEPLLWLEAGFYSRRQDAFNLVNLHMRRYLEGNFAVIPPIFNQTWWTWVYKLVGLHPQAENIPAFLATDNDLMGTFAVFQTCRIDQEANEAYYVPDTVNDGTLEATMAGNFARQAIQNFKEHLRGLQQHIAILWQAALEPRLNRMEAKRASAQLARAIVHHDPQPPADLLNLDIAEDYQ